MLAHSSLSAPPSASRRRWIFLTFLVALHGVFFLGPDSALGRLLFLSHIGIGLLWQPFVQPERRLGFGGMLLVILSAALLAYFLSWGVLLLWVMLLAGVAGGKVFLFPDRWERLFHLMALGYLVATVLILILPASIVPLKLVEPRLVEWTVYLLPGLFVIMAALPAGRGKAVEHAEIVDFIYGVLVFLLLAVIALGSLSFALTFKAGYFEALLVTLSLVAGILLLLGWIWNPRAGFGGMGSAVARHVISLGLPVEDWLQSLAELSKHEEDPERFLALACAELPERMPGVVGGDWQSPGGAHVFGERQGHSSRFQHGRLNLGLVSSVRPSPALLWHYGLAARLLAEFHLGKWRAQELRRLSYLEAIHETGARLTHDVKNLLQSLDTLCAAAQEADAPSQRFNDLLRRQLPEIASRLRQTLIKLSAPDAPKRSEAVAATTWFAALEGRYASAQTTFLAVDDVTALWVPDATLFSSVAENLLQNIANKRGAHPAVVAEIRLGAAAGKLWLEVTDNGPAVAAGLSEKLFDYPAPSESGLGVGLYQSARLAEQGGYRLALTENRDGCVRFRLAPCGQ